MARRTQAMEDPAESRGHPFIVGRSTGQSQPHSDPQDQKAGRKLSCCFLKFGHWSDFEVIGSASIYGGVHCMPSAVLGIEGTQSLPLWAFGVVGDLDPRSTGGSPDLRL